jgi:hypothetical protein
MTKIRYGNASVALLPINDIAKKYFVGGDSGVGMFVILKGGG